MGGSSQWCPFRLVIREAVLQSSSGYLCREGQTIECLSNKSSFTQAAGNSWPIYLCRSSDVSSSWLEVSTSLGLNARSDKKKKEKEEAEGEKHKKEEVLNYGVHKYTYRYIRSRARTHTPHTCI